MEQPAGSVNSVMIAITLSVLLVGIWQETSWMGKQTGKVASYLDKSLSPPSLPNLSMLRLCQSLTLSSMLSSICATSLVRLTHPDLCCILTCPPKSMWHFLCTLPTLLELHAIPACSPLGDMSGRKVGVEFSLWSTAPFIRERKVKLPSCIFSQKMDIGLYW